jgi:type I restriction enzyme M protein
MLTSEEIKFVFRSSIDFLRQDTYFSGNYSIYILPLLFFKWLSDSYKNNNSKDNESNTSFVLTKGVDWVVVKNIIQDISRELTNIFTYVEEANPTLRGVFIDPKTNQWERINDHTLQSIIELMSTLNLDKNNLRYPELLGEIYEDLLIKSALHERKTSVTYFTPSQLRKLIVNLVSPQVKMQIYDPACGSGGMLIESVRYFKEQGEELSNVSIYGQEEDYELRLTAIINLFLYGCEHHKIVPKSILKSPLLQENGNLKKFDLIITNPPFGVKNWEEYQVKPDVNHYLKYGLPPKSSADYAFIQYILATLNDTGKAAMIVPHGVLFRGGIEGEIRKNIVKDDLVETVIGLPKQLFYNTKIATAIIIFNRKKLDKRKDKILFIDASHEYESNRRQNFITHKMISRIVSTYSKFQEYTGYSKIASYEEISNYDYSLNISRYVEFQKSENNLDVGLQRKKVQTLETQRGEIEAQMDDYLRALGIEI